MPRMYTAKLTALSSSAKIDFFEFNTPATCVTKLHKLSIGQTTELGDAAEEKLIWFIKTAHSTSGSGGATATPVATDRGLTMAALNTSVENGNTTQATGGTPITVVEDVFDVRVGLLWIPTPEEWVWVPPSTRCVVGIDTTPGDSITWSAGTVWFEEY